MPLLKPGVIKQHKPNLIHSSLASRNDKVTLLTQTLRKIKVAICNYRADRPLYLRPGVCISDFRHRKEYGHTWHWMSSLKPGVIKHKLKFHSSWTCTTQLCTVTTAVKLTWTSPLPSMMAAHMVAKEWKKTHITWKKGSIVMGSGQSGCKFIVSSTIGEKEH